MQQGMQEKVAYGAAVVCVLADIIADSYSLHGYAIDFDSGWVWAVLAGVMIAAVAYTEPLVDKIIKAWTKTEIDAVVECLRCVDPSITARWTTVLHQFGINPDEPRAEITGFGNVLDQIEAAEAARLGSSNRAVRVVLGERVMILMRETLGPLAAELEYLRTEEHRIGMAILDILDNLGQQRQYERDAAAELLACSPI